MFLLNITGKNNTESKISKDKSKVQQYAKDFLEKYITVGIYNLHVNDVFQGNIKTEADRSDLLGLVEKHLQDGLLIIDFVDSSGQNLIGFTVEIKEVDEL